MQVLYARCAGVDLGKDMLVAAARLQEGSTVTRACRTYRTTRRHVLDLVAWLEELGVTHVVMEATGSYWKSVWHVLEGHFELTLASPAQIKNLPGRKSDVNDATWMADLHAHGLVASSFVPPAPIEGLRELTRTRKQFVREIGRHTLRIQKLLDVAGLKITGPISEILGVSGRRIIKALIAGKSDPEQLAELVDPHVKASRSQIVEALQGELTAPQRRLLKVHLKLIESLARFHLRPTSCIEEAPAEPRMRTLSSPALDRRSGRWSRRTDADRSPHEPTTHGCRGPEQARGLRGGEHRPDVPQPLRSRSPAGAGGRVLLPVSPRAHFCVGGADEPDEQVLRGSYRRVREARVGASGE